MFGQTLTDVKYDVCERIKVTSRLVQTLGRVCTSSCCECFAPKLQYTCHFQPLAESENFSSSDIDSSCASLRLLERATIARSTRAVNPM